MEQAVFSELCEVIYEQSGIRIKEGKKVMLASRLAKRLRALDITDERSYLEHLRRDLDREIVFLLDSVSTNVTHFFRESEHFEFIREQMTRWLADGQTRFRFWSAASSTGQEPYTLAMTLLDTCAAAGRQPDIKILATDISTRVLAEAEAGVYDEEKMAGVPAPMRARYFDRTEVEGQPVFRARRELRDMIVFKRVNLSQPPFPMRGPMSVILCRNVMIYFDEPVRRALIEEFCGLLGPDSFLIVGKSESLTAAGDLLDRAGTSTYRIKTDARNPEAVS